MKRQVAQGAARQPLRNHSPDTSASTAMRTRGASFAILRCAPLAARRHDAVGDSIRRIRRWVQSIQLYQSMIDVGLRRTARSSLAPRKSTKSASAPERAAAASTARLAEPRSPLSQTPSAAVKPLGRYSFCKNSSASMPACLRMRAVFPRACRPGGWGWWCSASLPG